MNRLYKAFLILSSLMLTCAIYLIGQEHSIVSALFPWLDEKAPFVSRLLSYLIYISVCIILSTVGFLILKRLPTEKMTRGTVSSVEIASDTHIPIYLAYFFVALSIDHATTFIVVFSIIFIFVNSSSLIRFDPLYSLAGFKLYGVMSSSNVKSYIISKRTLKNPTDVEFNDLRRINDFTFLDLETP
ncbi:hypothetical protein CTT39_08545 [Agrobacterium rosae]|nr:hypothetical protein CTT39_08545 [Agrobacterium rosae]